MDDVFTAQLENENLKKIRSRLMRWEAKNNPLAALSLTQEEQFEVLNTLCTNEKVACDNRESCALKEQREDDKMTSLEKLQQMPSAGIDTTHDFLLWFDQVHSEIYEERDTAAQSYLQQLTNRSHECSRILQQIEQATKGLQTLKEEYTYVSLKTEHLNKSSEQLIEEQQSLQKLANEIQQHLYYFNQVELLNQRLYSPTLSVTSDAFRECLCKIDECLNYVNDHSQYKEAPAFIVKYKHCLNKAISLIRNYVYSIMTQCTEATLHPKQMGMSGSDSTAAHTAPDAAFALYYGKYQIAAVKIKHIIRMVESRVGTSAEYGDLLSDLQHNYVQQRSVIMTPAVDKAITDIKVQHKGDHCALMRSACAFLVHICHDEHRLYYQFFVNTSDQLTTYLESLCNTLYDTMRPYIIHINHLETLAEICSILRIEMLEEHVQQNPTALEAFGTVVHQLLQDVQERLVFRAYLYLQSDILHYNPSAGDLAYPEKLEMMERIALSLQEANQMRRFDSRSSLVSCASNNTDLESVDTSVSRLRTMNSPADLHGMWYPTVRRTLVCLSRLYRCVDRPIFQGLSQEALKLCIQSVGAAATKISAAKTAIDGELFEIKHMLILREQIAPFRVDFTVKETSLDFSKVKSAAFGLLQKRKQLFTIGSNNALLEFLLEGTPQIKEHMLDSRKAVDRQLKMVCEQFIQDAVKELIAPLLNFLQRAYQVVGKNNSINEPAPATVNQQQSPQMKINYNLRQSAWASPQQISSVIQETQRLIKKRLPILQRSMQLYLSNRDTEFIIFRPIRNNVIKNFANLEQLLINNSYSSDDMVITSCPSTEQVSILLSSASILTAEGMINFSKATLQQPQRSLSENNNEVGVSCSQTVPPRKISYEKKVSFDNPSTTPITTMENVDELQTSSLNYSAVASAESTNIDFKTNK